MSFIRTKILKGKPYLFEVETFREGKKIKQGQKYLGPAKDLTIKQDILRKKIFDYTWFIFQELECWKEREDCHNTKIPESSHFMYLVALKSAKELMHYTAEVINAAGWVDEQIVSTSQFYKMLSLSSEILTLSPYCRLLLSTIENFQKEVASLIGEKASHKLRKATLNF